MAANPMRRQKGKQELLTFWDAPVSIKTAFIASNKRRNLTRWIFLYDWSFWRDYLSKLVWNWFSLALTLLAINELSEWIFQTSFRWIHNHRGKIVLALIFLAQASAFYSLKQSAIAARQNSSSPLKLDVTEHGVDDQSRQEIADLKQQLKDARDNAQKARESAFRAEAATKPQSFKQRLRACLDSIDPSITAQAIGGRYTFQGDVEMNTARELQKLASEPEASDYFSLVKVTGSTGLYSGDKQISGAQFVELIVEPSLMQEDVTQSSPTPNTGASPH